MIKIRDTFMVKDMDIINSDVTIRGTSESIIEGLKANQVAGFNVVKTIDDDGHGVVSMTLGRTGEKRKIVEIDGIIEASRKKYVRAIREFQSTHGEEKVFSMINNATWDEYLNHVVGSILAVNLSASHIFVIAVGLEMYSRNDIVRPILRKSELYKLSYRLLTAHMHKLILEFNESKMKLTKLPNKMTEKELDNLLKGKSFVNIVTKFIGNQLTRLKDKDVKVSDVTDLIDILVPSVSNLLVEIVMTNKASVYDPQVSKRMEEMLVPPPNDNMVNLTEYVNIHMRYQLKFMRTMI